MHPNKSFTVKKIVFCAVSIALATVTANFIKLPSLPFGGSTTLFSMMFVCLPGYWYGPVTGLCATVAHGLIQLISNPYVIHPLQLILDYVLAFGALGLSGFFSKKKNGLYLGYTAGVFGRFVFASLSGAVFFTEYVGVMSDDISSLFAGILYNMTYIVPEYILTMVLILLPPVKKGLAYIKKLALQ